HAVVDRVVRRRRAVALNGNGAPGVELTPGRWIDTEVERPGVGQERVATLEVRFRSTVDDHAVAQGIVDGRSGATSRRRRPRGRDLMPGGISGEVELPNVVESPVVAIADRASEDQHPVALRVIHGGRTVPAARTLALRRKALPVFHVLEIEYPRVGRLSNRT